MSKESPPPSAQDEKTERFRLLGEGRSPDMLLPGPVYTRLVRVLRLTLPLLALAIIAVLFSWPHMQEAGIQSIEEEALDGTAGTNELLNPRFESRDARNQPYTLTAARAVQSPRDPDVIALEKPMADITLNSGAWIAAEANRGAYRQNAEKLLLEGKVKLFHDKGYEMQTEKLLVNLQARKAWSDVDVYGQGPAGTIAATGVQADQQAGKVIFTGPVKLVLNRSIEGL